MSRPSEAYYTSHRALTTTLAPCDRVELFTADTLSNADQPVLCLICHTCPPFDKCRIYADTAGLWVGKTCTTRTKKDKNK